MIIFPSYLCNFKCPFCGIRKETSPLMPLDWLAGVIAELKPARLTILGGEPMLLKDDYLEELVSMCAEATGKPPSLYSNGSIIKPILAKTKPVFSFDPEDREKGAAVLNNILVFDHPYDFNTILTKNLVAAGAEKFERKIKHLPLLERIDLCLYHRFPGHDDMAPTDEEVDAFVSQLTDKRIHFLKRNMMKDFSEVVKALPDKRFLVETPDHKKMATADTLEEARVHYERLKNEFNSKL